MDIECCICMETKNTNNERIFNILPCNHILCLNCLCEMRKYECPLCRYNFKKLVSTRLINIIENNNSLYNSNNSNNSNNSSNNRNNFDFSSEYQFPPLKK